MKRLLAFALLACAGGAWYLALPPRAADPPPSDAAVRGGVRGAIHVHTKRSDGTGTVDEVAAAAARAGLDFVVLTDHGDGARKPDAPRYLSGVLCIDAVEISTFDGHLVALGLGQTPYPLGGEARDVVEDVHRLGGLAIAAHPASQKPELRWTAWNVPVGGLEWLNADSEWRDESRWTLARALFTYPGRQIETLASLLDRPDVLLHQWDTLTTERRVVALAGADAHARIGLRSIGEPYENGASLHLPSYEQVFRLFSNVVPDLMLTHQPEADAQGLMTAIREGHVYSVVDAIASGGAMSFTATDGTRRETVGDVADVKSGKAISLRVDVSAPSHAQIALLRNGTVIARGVPPGLEYVVASGAAGAYRVEVSLPDAPGTPPVPWILSNPIYAGVPASAPLPPGGSRGREPRPPKATLIVRYGDGPATDWTIETSTGSRAALDVIPAQPGTQIALRYALGGTASSSPYAAFSVPAGPSLAQADRLQFTARADRPMRLSVQLRRGSGATDERWRRSVVLDTDPREVTVYFDDMRPVAAATPDHPPLDRIDSMLFVIDTVNTAVGSNGRIWIDDVKYGR